MNAAWYVGIQSWVLKALKVPPDPSPPSGAPGSLRVFRAGRNYYRLRFWIWAAKQTLAALSFVVTFAFIHYLMTSGAESMVQRMQLKGRHQAAEFWEHAGKYVGWVTVAEGLGFAFFLAQLPISYAFIRLEYEQRWYLITDRSLRLRHGLWNVREMTVSFANIQQTTLRQGPLERFLGLADLVVTTAGGGSVAHGPNGPIPTPFHTGVLHAVDNAEEIRDLIQERLRRLKGAGLGDHDDSEFAVGAPEGRVMPGETCGGELEAARDGVVRAARELLSEVRELRRGWRNEPAGAGSKE